MSKMRQIFLPLLILCITSCTTINNVSKSSDFKSEIGSKVLMKNAFVCEINIDNRGLFEQELPKNELYENHGFKSCPFGKDVASLKIGAKVSIDEASYREHFGLVSYTDHWYLVGSTNVNDTKVHFYFKLGLTTDSRPPNDFKDKLLWK